MKTTSELDEVFMDGPIVQMMLGVVQSQVRTSIERFGGSGPDFTAFPQWVKEDLIDELGESNLPKKFTLLGVRIEWRT